MSRYDHIVEIEKFNPYHDSRGRFSTADAATQFTYAPGKSKAHDMAIAREKERHNSSPEGQKALVERQKASIVSAKTKKGQFDIYVNNLNEVRGKKGRRTVSGRIDAENNIGYHKNSDRRGAQWHATDLRTGLSLGTYGSTLKEVQGSTAERWEAFSKIKGSKDYARYVEAFNAAPHE